MRLLDPVLDRVVGALERRYYDAHHRAGRGLYGPSGRYLDRPRDAIFAACDLAAADWFGWLSPAPLVGPPRGALREEEAGARRYPGYRFETPRPSGFAEHDAVT